MNKLIYLLSTGLSTLAAYTLLTSAVTPIQQVNQYTTDLTRASEGRQISVIAPSPQAPMMTGLGVMFGLVAVGSIWKLLEGESENTNQDSPRTVPRYRDADAIAPNEPQHYRAQATDRPADRLGTVPDNGGSVLMSSKLQPLVITGLVSTVGGQGSGKTTLNAAIIRERIKLGHRVIVIDHHSAYGENVPLEVYGDGDTLEEQIRHCEEGLRKLIDLRDERYATRKRKPESEWDFMSEPVTFLIEELGEYAGIVDERLMNLALKTICAGVRKANIYVILSSQNDTMAMFGGTKGMAKMLQEGFVRLELENQPDANRSSGLGPKGTGWLSINGSKPVNVKIPDVSAMFPSGQALRDFTDLYSSKVEGSFVGDSGSDSSGPIDDNQPLALLERSLSLPAYEPSSATAPIEELLTTDEQIVLDIALASDGPITARHIMKTNKLGANADEIRLIFRRLSSLEYGSISGEGKKLSFDAY